MKEIETLRIEELKRLVLFGFAHLYLYRFHLESKTDDEIDVQVYAKLVQLDSRCGLNASLQLYGSIHKTTRSDVIQVLILLLKKDIHKDCTLTVASTIGVRNWRAGTERINR